MSRNKTVPTGASVEEFLQSVEPERKSVEAQELDRLFRKVTGFQPHMWGPSIIGYGCYRYRYATGREGEFLATGFAPRRARHSIYIMPGYQDYSAILSRLGKHKLGKSCLYVNKLADIDLDVLAELIKAGLRDLNGIWPVQPE
ncbi:DUF1801 domain-containing protein [Leisingera daeponensis]|uniref:DUF1801 domain-containing protein n=1 Tax=Leisingera daeponensis TaxID=405746 RepID=A0ABS7NK90_9RHOB|nr:DUF1801 domain-containing protein [Leisingera daeponensis]MBY6140541.1 DUF1801 domain-containing protein [Leisingera daeponensis]